MPDKGFEQFEESKPDKKDEEISRLSEELERLKDDRLEERFFWILLLIILLDFHMFSYMSNWGGPIAILVLEVIFLLIIARKCGIEDIEQWLDKYLHSIKKDDK